ncbi:MAG TPA: hypothetical protein VNP04_27060 [Alphaproteobacteria bacterium]|nr:hypothetical protein [Alphaproteobacteria bacterium]
MTIGDVVLSFADGDQVAASLSGALLDSPLLDHATAEEYGRIVRQEAEHAALFRAWAKKLGATRRVDWYSATLDRDRSLLLAMPDGWRRVVWVLAGLSVNEAQAVLGFRRWSEDFMRLGWSDLAKDISRVGDDEAMHLATSRTVLRTLHSDRPELRREIERAVKLTRLAYAPILARQAREVDAAIAAVSG